MCISQEKPKEEKNGAHGSVHIPLLQNTASAAVKARSSPRILTSINHKEKSNGRQVEADADAQRHSFLFLGEISSFT